MPCETDRPLTQTERAAGFRQQRTGVPQAVRPYMGPIPPGMQALIDYLNRELIPAVRQTRNAVNEVYLPSVDNAPSANPLGYYFSAETAAADPTAGRLRLNQAVQNTATRLLVSEENGRLQDVGVFLDIMAGSATVPLGVVTLVDSINPGRYVRFDLNAITDQGDYWELTVVPTESSHDNPFVDGEGVILAFMPGVGSTPATVPISVIAPALAGAAGGGLVWDAGNLEFDVGAGDGIDVAADSVAVDVTDIVDNVSITEVATNNIQRAALTGFAAAAAGSNATTSAEPLVTYSASANMSAERVLSNGTNTVVDVGTANQIQIDVDDFPLTGLADQAAGTVLANVTAGAAPPTAHSLTTLAGAGLTYTNVTGIMAVGAGTGITVNANDVQLATIADDTFMANVSGGAAVATGKTFASLAGGGLTYDATNHELDVVVSTSIVVTGGQLQRPALTGEVTAPANSNATTIDRATDFDASAWTGPHQYDGLVTINNELRLTSVSNPAALANGGSTNNYAPTDWGTSTVATLAVSGSGSHTITGIDARSAALKLVVCEAGTITFLNDSASSTAINRILIPHTSMVLHVNDLAIFWYDDGQTRWRVMKPGATS